MDNKKLLDLATKIRNIRKETSKVDFEDVKAYCVSKYEEIIGIFMEIGKFLEDNIGLFIDQKIGYSLALVDTSYLPRRKGYPENGVGLERNKVNLIFSKRDSDKGYSHVVHVWLNDGICFVYNVDVKRVTYITNNANYRTGKEILDYHSFPQLKLFSEWDGGTFPNFGYERFAKVSSPVFETYFKDIRINSLGSLIALKKKIDEDYETAIQCVRCLEHDVEGIYKDEKEYLDKMMKLKESTNGESNNER